VKWGTHHSPPTSLLSKETITQFGKRLNPGKNNKHHSPQSVVTPYRRDHGPRVTRKKFNSSQNTFRRYLLHTTTYRIQK
jgi:hypothetical protein